MAFTPLYFLEPLQNSFMRVFFHVDDPVFRHSRILELRKKTPSSELLAQPHASVSTFDLHTGNVHVGVD
jgi:hypothetical protein